MSRNLKVSQLFTIFPEYLVGNSSLAEVDGVFRDSRQVRPGGVYVAIKGYETDGHDYILQAIEGGAVALVVENEKRVPSHFSGAVASVSNSRLALQMLASRYYGDPANDLFCIGITGTNGKTTTSYMIEHILQKYGWNVGVLGTIDHHLGSHQWKSQLTTPDAIDLQKRLKEFQVLNAHAAAFEVSSHALSQFRVDGLAFDVAVFTNLSRDHLDFHMNMKNYFESKQRLFSSVLADSKKVEKFAVINTDDKYGRQIRVADGIKVFSYGADKADITYNLVSCDFAGSVFQIKTPRGEAQVHLKLLGTFNILNALAATGVGLAAGASVKTIGEALSGFSGVPGRLELVQLPKGNPAVFVDYAHTPDALENVLKEINGVKNQSGAKSRIITVFGCGGDRDVGKRPLMGGVAAQNSDIVFITSDNPRSEDPEKIIREIMGGIDSSVSPQKIFINQDRKIAIGRALQIADSDDVILIAGKGHEPYQILGDKTIDFDDRLVVKDLVNDMDS